MDDKEQQNVNKSSDEIVEETMKEILESLAESDEKEDVVEESKALKSATPSVDEYQKEKDVKSSEDLHDSEVIILNDEETMEEKLEQYRKKKRKKRIIASVMGAVVLVYLGISIYFVNHFYFGTKINGVSFSGKSAADVEEYMKKQVKDYTLSLKERNEKAEVIRGADFELKYKNGKGVRELLKEQNPLLWITSFFTKNDEEAMVEVDYNKEKFDQIIGSLECLKEENQVAPVSAQPVFNGQEFEIQAEQPGTQIDQEVFSKALHDAVAQFRHELDLDKENCYVKPKFKSDDKKVTEAKDFMNSYLNASITYKVDPVVVVDKALISQWLVVDEEMNATFSSDALGAFLDEFCNQYNTVGKVRTITTPTGKTAQVSGGGYGWKIDRDAEYEMLTNNIKAGDVVEREPVYSQTAAAHGAADWGSTYLEVDLSNQHMWYIVNGNIALETDVVTGIPVPKRQTPQGVYTILEMKRNKTLRGEKKPDGTYEYETPVDYWMRVTWTGIGFHDAGWQSSFGGEIYKTTRGSHGCINMPPSLAGKLYGMLKVGCPVVIHY